MMIPAVIISNTRDNPAKGGVNMMLALIAALLVSPEIVVVWLQ